VPRTRDHAVTLERLRVLIGALTRSARSVERRTGVTNAQLFILQQLANAPGLSINDLAARAHTRQNAVSTVVARLARDGLVKRSRSADDGRRVTLALTAAGRALVRRAPAPPTARVIAALDTLPEREIRLLARSLDALIRAMALQDEKPGMLFEDGSRARSKSAASEATAEHRRQG
jgi:DNA-binding MarR family transcriptional regulator